MTEVLPQFSHIFIPENKQSAWIYRGGMKKLIKKDPNKQHQGVWAVPHTVTVLKPSPIEVWAFLRDRKTNHLELYPGILDNNPNHGKVAYDPKCEDIRKATPEQMWFYPPGVSLPKGVKNAGVWVKPEYKRDMTKLGDAEQGFFKVSAEKDAIHKGGKLGIKGGWKTFGAQQFVKNKNKPNDDGDGGKGKGFIIYVRTHKGEVFDLPCIPGNKISAIKTKIEKKRKIPISDQRLSFEGIDLKDEKTVVGSGVRNGDTIDLGPMHIFLRNAKGKKFTLHVEHDEAINDVMQMVQDVEGTPVEKQILSFKRMQMFPGKKLSTYKVRHRSTIDLSGMIIFVELLSGEKVELDVDPTDTISRVKTKVKNRTQMPVAQQTLYFKGRHLDKDGKDLNFYNIQHLDTLVMAESAPDNGGGAASGGMKIFIVKDWDKKKFVLTRGITPTTLIEKVKEMIEKKEKIPIPEQRLTFKKKSVYNKKTLEQSKIKHNAILHLSKLGATQKAASPTISTSVEHPDDSPVDVTKRRGPSSPTPGDGPKNGKKPKVLDDDIGDDDDPDLTGVSRSVPPPKKSPLDDAMDIEDNDDPPVVSEKKNKKQPDRSLSPQSRKKTDRSKSPQPRKKNPDRRKSPPPRKKQPPPKVTDDEIDDDDSDNPDDDDAVHVRKSVPPSRDDDSYDDPNDPGRGNSSVPDNPNKGPKGKPSRPTHSDDDVYDDDPEGLMHSPDSPKSRDDPYDDDDEPENDDRYDEDDPNRPGYPSDIPRSRDGDPRDDPDNPIHGNKSIPNKPNNSRGRPGPLNDDMDDDDAPPNIAKIDFDDPDQPGRKPGKPRQYDDEPYDNDDPVRSIKPRHDIPDGAPHNPLDDPADYDSDDSWPPKPKNRKNVLAPVVDFTVKTPNGNKVTLSFPPEKTIDDVKEEIAEKLGIPKRGQRIFYMDGDEEIPGDLPVSKTKLPKGMDYPIKLDVRPPELWIEFPNRPSRSFILDPDDTVEDLKKEIAKQTGEPPGQRILRNGEELDPDVVLPDIMRPGDVFTLAPNEIEIELPGSGKTRLGVLPTHTVDDIKDMIEEKTGIPKRGQRLFFLDGDDELPDDAAVAKEKIEHGTTLKLRPPKVKVKGPNGKSRVFPVVWDEPVKDFKKKVYKKLGIPRGQRLMFDDTEMDDDAKVSDLLHHGDVLTTAPPGLDVSLPKGKVTLQSLPAKTIGDVKADIEDETGVPVRAQRIFYMDGDEELPDDTPLAKTKIKQGQKIEMRLPEIEVMAPDGKSRTFFLDPDDTANDLKQKSKQFLDNQNPPRLFVDGEELDDDEKLVDRLKNGQVLTTEPNKVKVDLPDGSKAFLNTLPIHTIEDIKDIIEEKTGIPKRGQRLFFLDKDEELPDDTPVSKTKIGKGKSLKLRPPKIKVKTPSKSRVFAMDFEETGKDFKDRVRKKLGLGSGQPLYFDGDEIEDDEELLDRLHHADVVTTEPPKFDIEIPEGKVYLEILPKHTISEIKDMIEEETGVPRHKQRIFFLDGEGDEELPDDTPLSKTRIREGGKLGMRISQDEPTTPKLSKSREFTLTIDPDDMDGIEEQIAAKTGIPLDDLDIKTVEDIKDVVEEKLGIPRRQQRIFFLDNDEELEGDVPLAQTRIKEGVEGIDLSRDDDDDDINDQDEPRRFGSREFTLTIDPDDSIDDIAAKIGIPLDDLDIKTVEDIKDVVEEKLGVPRRQQRIFFLDNDEELEDDVPLAQARIKEGVDKNDLSRQEEDPDEPKRNGSREFTLTIDPDDMDGIGERLSAKIGIPLDDLDIKTVEDIKDVVEEKLGIPRRQQRIFFLDNDEELEDGVSLAQTRIKEGVDGIDLSSDDDDPDEPQRNRSRDFTLVIDPDDDIDDIREKVSLQIGIPLDDLDIETVEDIKDVVEEKLGIPRRQQRIFFLDNDEELEDDFPLAKTAIREGYAADTSLDAPEEIKKLKKNNTRNFVLMIDPDDTVEDVKKKVAEKTGLQFDGELFNINTVEDIKDVVEEKLGIPKREARVFYLDDEQELPDDVPLTRQKVKHTIMPYLEPTSIQINVKHWNGDEFTFRVSKNEYVDDVKDKIEETQDIPVEHQRLLFKGEPVDETLTLEEHGIVDKSTLVLEGMTIHVKVPDGERIALSVQPEYTIARVKGMLFALHGTPAADQCLLSGGTELSDHESLSECNIDHDDEIIMEIFEIRVVHWLGEVYPVGGISRNDKIEIVKRVMHKKHKIPLEQQQFMFDGQVVNKTMTLKEQNVVHKSVLTMQEPRQVEITLPEQEKLTLTVFNTTTTAEVKEVIEEKIPEMAVRQQRIFFFDDPEEIDDETPFVKLKLEKGIQVELVSLDLTIKHWNGEAFVVSVSPDEYIDDLKDRVAQLHDIPVFQQRLVHNGKALDDTLTFEDQGILDKSTLDLQPMKIHVQVQDGKKLSFVVEPEYTISKIKGIVFTKVGVPANDQCLVIGGDELEDDLTLLESRVDHDDVIVMEIFEISVMDWMGETFSLSGIRRNDTIDKVKQTILKQRDIPIDQQRIVHNGERLSDDAKLWEYGIVHKSVLVLVSPDDGDIELPEASKVAAKLLKTAKFKEAEGEIWPVVPNWRKRIFFFDSGDGFDSKIRVMVTLLNGDVLTFDDLRPMHTVDAIKTRILKQRKHIKKKNYKLKFKGKRLDDKKSLLSQKIEHNSAIIMEALKEKRLDDLPQTDKLRFNVLPAAEIGKKINLVFKVWTGEKFELEVEPTDYIDDVKEQIEATKNIPVDQQRITFKKNPVDDSLTLKEQNITDKSRLVLEPMKIHVEVDGQMQTYTVELEQTISKLKGLMFSKLGVPAIDQVILFGSDELEDDKTLEECEVDHDDVLAMECFEISVLHWSGETFVVPGVRRTDKIDKVRSKLDAKTPIPKGQIFKLEGNPVDESLSLKEQNIPHKAIMTIEDSAAAGVSVPKFERFSLSLFPTTVLSSDDDDNFGESFRVVVRHWNGKKFNVDAEPTDYIDDLKEKIESSKGIPFDDQRLTFKGQPVDDTLTLKEQNITHKSRLDLEPMSIHVNVPDGKSQTFEVEPGFSISKLKGLLFSRLGIPASDQAIVDGGEELADNQTLADCQIDHDDVITMEIFEISYVRLPGDPQVLPGVRRTDTIERVKKKVLVSQKIPLKQQQYKFKDTPIDDSKTLQEQGLTHRAILILEEGAKNEIENPRQEKFKLSMFPAVSAHSKHSKDTGSSDDGAFTLFIQPVTGAKFSINADPTDYIDDVKDKICELKGIPVEQQRISFNGTLVDDTLTLDDQNIANKSKLVMEPMRIHVDVPGGKTLTLAVNQSDTVARLKGLLFSKLGTPANDQCIILGGEELEDDLTVEECELDDGDSLRMEMYEISVFHWSGETMVLSGIRRSDTLERVKKKVATRLAKVCKVKRSQKFKFQDVVIDETKTLQEQNLKHKSILVMVEPASKK